MKATDKTITWEGAIEIWEQEGGYAESYLEFDGDIHPVREIEEAFEELIKRDYGDSRLALPGRWRLTLERIE